jgi:hypothetical protein
MKRLGFKLPRPKHRSHYVFRAVQSAEVGASTAVEGWEAGAGGRLVTRYLGLARDKRLDFSLIQSLPRGIEPMTRPADVPAMNDGRYCCQHAVRTSRLSAG